MTERGGRLWLVAAMRQDDCRTMWLAHLSCGRVVVSLVGGGKNGEARPVIGRRAIGCRQVTGNTARLPSNNVDKLILIEIERKT